jgi:hypothetical protein
MTTTCGRAAARASSSRRNATRVSSGEAAMTVSGDTPDVPSSSTSGQYVMPSP